MEPPSISTDQEQRAEMEAVLQSGLFARAPNLESFFRYICEHHFRGSAQQLKEYNIAVEALGRPAQFDQKKDSIVRVEAHHLRKRLGDYYAGPGAHHAIHILIPRGSYAPEFLVPKVALVESPPDNGSVSMNPQSGVPTQPESVSKQQVFSLPALPQFVRGHIGWTAAAICMLIAAFGFAKWKLIPTGSEMGTAIAGDVVPAEFRMLAGYVGGPVADIQGHEWSPDVYYSGGSPMKLPERLTIRARVGARFFNTARTGKFDYDIPLREGVFELHLYFVETEYGAGNPRGGGDGSRLFQLAINGRSLVDLFDVHAQAGGPNRLFIRVFKDISRAADGRIHISFSPVIGTAILSAIEILPSEPGRIRPIRIVAQEHPVTDSDGQVWSADEFVEGGILVSRHNTKFADRKFVVYQGERYGNFTYHLPLAPGRYRLTLHFAETWFGTPSASINSNEHRLFDVYANGLGLVRKFDLLSEAGAPNRGIEKVFEGLEPNAQGELNLHFVPLTNYAEVNAIEIVETE